MENERAGTYSGKQGANIRETKIKREGFRLCQKRMNKIEKEMPNVSTGKRLNARERGGNGSLTLCNI